MKKTVKQEYKIKKAIIMALLVINGCGNGNWTPTSHIVFVDYTSSCKALDDFNRENVKKRILDIAKKLKNEDQIFVYPIHANTQSASPVVIIKPPKLKGDLMDKKRFQIWVKDTLSSAIDEVINYSFSPDALAGTNVFPAMRKANRIIKNGMNVKLYFISDMVHELSDLSFKEAFPTMNVSEMNSLAADKANLYCPNQSLKDVVVNIYIPGRPDGLREDPTFHHSVNCFWEEFFSHAGTSINIWDLQS